MCYVVLCLVRDMVHNEIFSDGSNCKYYPLYMHILST